MTSQLCDPKCPICAGVGYVRSDKPLGHPEFGQVMICPKREKHLQATLGAGGLYPDEVQDLSWKMVQDNRSMPVWEWPLSFTAISPMKSGQTGQSRS